MVNFKREVVSFVYIVCFIINRVSSEDNQYREARINGFTTIDPMPQQYIDEVPLLETGEQINLRIFGIGLESNPQISLTKHPSDCLQNIPVTTLSGAEKTSKKIKFILPSNEVDSVYYFCIKQADKWVHQGTDKWVTFYTHTRSLLSILGAVLLSVVCMLLSSLMSGLNLGLMSLDLSELTVISRSGSPSERKYAQKIIPVRRHGNFLLCSILLTCTFCNAIFTVHMNEMISDWLTIVISTFTIVLACEILPQAICSRAPLFIGAHTILITKACMTLTAVISYPLGKILDKLLGEEMVVYPRERLKELIKLSELKDSEKNIISGTLEMCKKNIEDIMTVKDDIFALPDTTLLDFETIENVICSGYSRVPIYSGDINNIKNVLMAKDLALIDPDDKIPVSVLCQMLEYNCIFMSGDTKLDTAFKKMKEGSDHGTSVPKHVNFVKTLFLKATDAQMHMAFVTHYNEETGEIKVVGLLTLEDIIEEITQTEIVDETDIFADNRTKRRISHKARVHKLTDVLNVLGAKNIKIPRKVLFVTYQYLNTIAEFKTIHPSVLYKLLTMTIIHYKKKKKRDVDERKEFLYEVGKAADYCILILEGRAEVKIGADNMTFEAGPFSIFGLKILSDNVDSFIPDFTLELITDTYYFKMTKMMYKAAQHVTRGIQGHEEPQTDGTELLNYIKILSDENTEE